VTVKAKIVCAVVAGFAGGLAAAFLASPASRAAAPSPVPEKKNVARAADDSCKEEVVALRKRVKELEKRLAEKKAEAAAETMPEASAEVVEVAEKPARAERRFGPPDLKALEKEDPARYTEFTNRMATFRARHLARQEERLQTLASVDVKRMSRAEREAHDEYQELIVRREELREAFRPDAEGVTEEERRAAFEEMHTLERRIRELAQTERDTVTRLVLEDVGVAEEEMAGAVESLRAVNDMTNEHGGGMPPPAPGEGAPGPGR